MGMGYPEARKYMKYFKSAYYTIIRLVHWHDVDASGAIRQLLQTASITGPVSSSLTA